MFPRCGNLIWFSFDGLILVIDKFLEVIQYFWLVPFFSLDEFDVVFFKSDKQVLVIMFGMSYLKGLVAIIHLKNERKEGSSSSCQL